MSRTKKNLRVEYIKIGMAWVKKVARKAEKKVFGSKGVKGRYGIGKGKGGFKFLQLAKDLEMVKSRLNVEKKFVDEDVLTSSVGQVSGNVNGAYYRDMTPIISQGVGESQRTGNSLKLTGCSIPLQFRGMSNCFGNRKLRISVLKVRTADLQVSPLEVFEKVWDQNPVISNGIRDYNAPRAYRNSKNDGISVIYSKTYMVKAPTIDSGASSLADYEAGHLTCRINLKLNDVLRYDTNNSSLPGGIKYIMVIQCDTGNIDLTTPSTLDIPVKTNDSGLYLWHGTRWWFVDN